MRRSWVPSKDHTNTGRICSAGSGHNPVPRRQSSYAALRLPHSRRPRRRSSLAFGLPRCGRFFCAACGGRLRVLPRTRSASEIRTSAPRGPLSSRGEMGPPRFLGRPLRACRGRRPRRMRHSARPLSSRPPSPSGDPIPWASGMSIAFEAASPTAHMLAYLRIAAPVTGNTARLATDLGGLTPDRTGFAPAGRQTKFHDFIASSILSDQPAWSHLNRLFAGLLSDKISGSGSCVWHPGSA